MLGVGLPPPPLAVGPWLLVVGPWLPAPLPTPLAVGPWLPAPLPTPLAVGPWLPAPLNVAPREPNPPVLAPCDAPPPKFPAGLETDPPEDAGLAGAEGFLSLPARASAPVPKSAATISAAAPFLTTLRRVDTLIGILNSLNSVGPQGLPPLWTIDLASIYLPGTNLFNVDDFSVFEGDLHVLVIEDFLHSQFGNSGRRSEGGDNNFAGSPAWAASPIQKNADATAHPKAPNLRT